MNENLRDLSEPNKLRHEDDKSLSTYFAAGTTTSVLLLVYRSKLASKCGDDTAVPAEAKA